MSGSLREKSPGVWEIRVALGRDPLTGTYQSVSRTVHGGKRKTQEEIARLGRQRQVSGHESERALPDRALAGTPRAPGPVPKTLEGYRSLIKNGIDPALGSIELAKLSASNIDRFYGLLQKKGLANNTIHHSHACLSAALHQAVRWGWIDHSPTVRATARRSGPEKSDPRAWMTSAGSWWTSRSAIPTSLVWCSWPQLPGAGGESSAAFVGQTWISSTGP